MPDRSAQRPRVLLRLGTACLIVASIAAVFTGSGYAMHDCTPPEPEWIGRAECSPDHQATHVDPGVPTHGVQPDTGGDRDGTNEGLIPIVPVAECGAARAPDPTCFARSDRYHRSYDRRVVQWGRWDPGTKHSHDLATTHYLGRGVVYVCTELSGHYSGKSYAYDCGNDDSTANFPGNNDDTMVVDWHKNGSRHDHTLDMYGYY